MKRIILLIPYIVICLLISNDLKSQVGFSFGTEYAFARNTLGGGEKPKRPTLIRYLFDSELDFQDSTWPADIYSFDGSVHFQKNKNVFSYSLILTSVRINSQTSYTRYPEYASDGFFFTREIDLKVNDVLLGHRLRFSPQIKTFHNEDKLYLDLSYSFSHLLKRDYKQYTVTKSYEENSPNDPNPELLLTERSDEQLAVVLFDQIHKVGAGLQYKFKIKELKFSAGVGYAAWISNYIFLIHPEGELAFADEFNFQLRYFLN